MGGVLARSVNGAGRGSNSRNLGFFVSEFGVVCGIYAHALPRDVALTSVLQQAASSIRVYARRWQWQLYLAGFVLIA